MKRKTSLLKEKDYDTYKIWHELIIQILMSGQKAILTLSAEDFQKWKDVCIDDLNNLYTITKKEA